MDSLHGQPPQLWTALSAAALSLSGCCTLFPSTCPPPTTACVDFDDLTAGQNVAAGTAFSSRNTVIALEPFQRGNGTWTGGNHARVDNRQYAGGSNLDINANNVNLHFLPDCPVDRVTLRFGELGGNNNLRINGQFSNIANLVTVNGTTLGGVQISVTANQQGNNWYGTMSFDGQISDFAIGGQELWLDDVCFRRP